MQEQSLLDSSSMTTKLLAGEYLKVKGGMWSSKGMLQIIRSKALALALPSMALSTTDSDYPSTSNSSPKGESHLEGNIREYIEYRIYMSQGVIDGTSASRRILGSLIPIYTAYSCSGHTGWGVTAVKSTFYMIMFGCHLLLVFKSRTFGYPKGGNTGVLWYPKVPTLVQTVCSFFCIHCL